MTVISKWVSSCYCKKKIIVIINRHAYKNYSHKTTTCPQSRQAVNDLVQHKWVQKSNRVSEKKNFSDLGNEKSRLIEKEWLNAFYAMQNTVIEERNKNNEWKNFIYKTWPWNRWRYYPLDEIITASHRKQNCERYFCCRVVMLRLKQLHI